MSILSLHLLCKIMRHVIVHTIYVAIKKTLTFVAIMEGTFSKRRNMVRKFLMIVCGHYFCTLLVIIHNVTFM